MVLVRVGRDRETATREEDFMKRSLALTTIAMVALSALLWMSTDAWARVGGGSSSGSRGSRSYSAPVRPSPSPVSPSRPAAPPPSPLQPTPQRSPWGGLGGMFGGLLLGGLIGSLLFGGMGHGLFGGIGFLEIAILTLVGYFIFRAMRARQPDMAVPSGYASPSGYGGSDWQPSSSSSYGSSALMEAPAPTVDVDRGIGYIRQMDPGFDATRFTETATDIFFKIQAAWTARSVQRIAELLTPEMQEALNKDCERLRAEHRINRLENIAVRQAAVTEAWQERGQDFVTVCFVANLLDYTTDESGSRVLEGDPNEPVKFEEFWTFVRPVGPNPWRLSAIQQSS
jgi:predicted lipid-binding transport protein (Tim44 family)